MSAWQIDITASGRAAAIGQVRRAALPAFAAAHLIGILKGEDYVHSGQRNPDAPLRVRGSGYDHGEYIDIETAAIEYLN